MSPRSRRGTRRRARASCASCSGAPATSTTYGSRSPTWRACSSSSPDASSATDMAVLRALVAKDIRRQLAQPLELIIDLAIPLVLSGLIFLAFGRFAREPDAGPTLKFAALDLDDSPLSRMVLGAGASSDRRLEVGRVASREEGLARLSRDEASALVVIPKGF